MMSNVKPTLELTRIPVYRVHADALNAYIVAKFAFDHFDTVWALGIKPPETAIFNVTGDLSSEYQQRAADLRNGRRTRNVALILNVLAVDGDIAKGTWIVETKEPPPPRVIYRRLLERIGNPKSQECKAFRERYHKDAELTKWFKTIDRIVTDQLAGKAA
jgi:hypothetical protein